MPSYQSLTVTAQHLNITENVLMDMKRYDWISTIEKNGTTFLSMHEEYKVRFILHLRTKFHLTDEEIAQVMTAQEAPYSLRKVSEVLGRELTA
jgi:hypothetical protein